MRLHRLTDPTGPEIMALRYDSDQEKDLVSDERNQAGSGSGTAHTRARVTAFFRRYQQAFEERDPELVRSCFHAPVCIATDTGTDVQTAWFDDAQWPRVIERLLARYHALRVGRVEQRGLEVLEISAQLVAAAVSWSLFDQRDELLYEFNAVYTLRLEQEPDGLGILAIAHNEVAAAGRPA